MAKTFNVYPNFRSINIVGGLTRIGTPTYNSVYSYTWTDCSSNDILTALSLSGPKTLQQMANGSIEPYSAYFPGSRAIDASKYLTVTPASAPYDLDDWIGYSGPAVVNPICHNTPQSLNFSTTGQNSYVYIMNQGEINWDLMSEISGLPSVSRIYVWDTSSLTYTGIPDGSLNIPVDVTNVIIISSTNLSTAANQTKKYYGWFGNSTTRKKAFRPPGTNNELTINWTFIAPTYLRHGYLDSTGMAGAPLSPGGNTGNIANAQSIYQSGGNWYFRVSLGNKSVISYLSGSWVNASGTFSAYVRKNGGAWQAMASLASKTFSPCYAAGSGHLLPFSLNTNGDTVDILWITTGQTLTSANQRAFTATDAQPGSVPACP